MRAASCVLVPTLANEHCLAFLLVRVRFRLSEQFRQAEEHQMEYQFRFGVFLRPDPKTCAAVTQITGQLRAQYGLTSAAAFPPHVTLAGGLPVVVPLAELIQLIGFVLRRVRAFTVQNLGVRRLADSALAYDVSAIDGTPNRPLSDLAGAVDSVVRPLLGPSGSLPPDLYEPDHWMPHIS